MLAYIASSYATLNRSSRKWLIQIRTI